MKRRGVKPNDPYDWERPLLTNEGLPTTRSLPTVNVPLTVTTAQTTPNVDTNNQENVEPFILVGRRGTATGNGEALLTNQGRDKNCNATIPGTDNTQQQSEQSAKVVAAPSAQGTFDFNFK